ncbi:NapC/NirT family cytochrome c [Teredinibacter sp. KSP-S5-2]|uniref:NapC/NirT family cytochrome c n=1 Tax=Teredinibacter sp. KSP-S5-2 TaxID=3034506 RepID=UPI0029344809|nr:NapC/NirT family cytochrome c [Teredinibacter sp. KSP-S5-2]WNO11004.1 NapC/NirT family cytochrome c [Teredinibacter sp. KSP-S5-2]
MPEEQSKWKKWLARAYWGIPLAVIPGFILGIIFLGSFNYVLHETNSMEFCISCHEMEKYVYEEYQQSTHFKNASGVRAECADCHLPHAWGPKVVKKIKKGFTEIPAKIMGTISTPEKFEAKKLEMAERVWHEMVETDSRECRNCHALESMNLDMQDRSASKRHTLERKLKKGETCIDCHKGVVHSLPQGYEE